MKKAPAGTGAGNGSAGSAGAIVADLSLCPFAPECRKRWTHLTGTEAAECGFCYQELTRSDLARILEGPPR